MVVVGGPQTFCSCAPYFGAHVRVSYYFILCKGFVSFMRFFKGLYDLKKIMYHCS